MKRIVQVAEELLADWRAITRSEGRPPSCLVVEDDPNDAELSAQALRSLGTEVTVAKTGDEAITLLNESKDPDQPNYAIAFIDLKLRGSYTQGYQVLEYIQKNFPAVHSVIVSGTVDDDFFRLFSGSKKGPSYVGIITKPLQVMDVREIMAKHGLTGQPATA